jgi:hypothetical protein
VHFTVDHAEPKPKIQVEQVQSMFGCPQASSGEDTNLALDQGKPQYILPKSLSFIFKTLFIILFDCALSLQDLYGIIAALGFFFSIILVYPCYNGYMSLELTRRRYRCRVVERLRVGNRCLYTHCYWRLMLDKMEAGWGHLGGPVEHSEGKGGESAMATPRFLCGSPRLCQLRTDGLVPVSKY